MFISRTKPNTSYSDSGIISTIFNIIKKIYKEWFYDAEITYDEDWYTYDSSTIETTTQFTDVTHTTTNWN